MMNFNNINLTPDNSESINSKNFAVGSKEEIIYSNKESKRKAILAECHIKKITTKRCCPICEYEHIVTNIYKEVPKWIEPWKYYEKNWELESSKSSKGKEFELVEDPRKETSLIDVLQEHSIKYIGMFCPNCGVFLNINKCTTVTEDVKLATPEE